MPTTDWLDLPPEDLTVELIPDGHRAEGTLQQQPQWIGFVEGPPIVDSTALTALLEDPAPEHIFTPMWEFSFDNNYNVRWHPAWSQNFQSFGRADLAAFPVIDPDGDAWRTAKLNEIRSQWKADHPSHTNVVFEWEYEVGDLFGTHSNRRINASNWLTERSATRYIQVEIEGGSINPQPGAETVIPPPDVPDTRLFLPPQPGALTGTYSAGVGDVRYTSTISDHAWSVEDVQSGDLVAQWGAVGGSEGLGVVAAVEAAIPDATFDALAVPVQHQSFWYRQSRGLVMWALPDVEAMWNPIYDANFEVDGEVFLTTSFQPPRYRISYETAAYRRNWPDSPARDARRNWPPSKSRRTSGGIL